MSAPSLHDQSLMLLVRLHGALTGLAARHDRDDRGDVPGWVMVTVMSAGIVAGLVGIAKPELQSMLRNALNSVK